MESNYFVISASMTMYRRSNVMLRRIVSIASWALRPGRNPYETFRKFASNMGSNTSFAAVWATLSLTTGIPSGRVSVEPGFGIH